jgi:hypothetical protein
VLLICAMEDERSPIIDIVGDTSKAPLPEVSMASSSSDASSGEWPAIRPKLRLRMPWICMNLRKAITLGCLWLLWGAFRCWKLLGILSKV